MDNSYNQPLAEKLRPQSIDEFVGQSEIMDNKGLLKQIVDSKKPTSLILWGPPGTGKTTIARILAKEFEAEFLEISGVTSGIKDVKNIVEHAKQNWNLKIRTVLFVDEIHRFNKSQQDAFLPHVESGLITLIGATTENPSFEVITPLLSRTRVIVLKKLKKDDIVKIIKNGLKKINKTDRFNKDAIEYIAQISDGDARVALGNLELALSLEKNKKITKKIIFNIVQNKIPGYDKNNDNHYDTISAFIKSMRAGDIDATLYYLARMMNAGEDPKFIARRMIIFASEDIGLAGNGALSLAVSTFQAVERVGIPESNYTLFHCATALAKSKKSRETTDLMYKAQKLAKEFPNAKIPLHIRNTSTKLMKELGYNKGYEWKAGFKHKNGFLPEEIKTHLDK